MRQTNTAGNGLEAVCDVSLHNENIQQIGSDLAATCEVSLHKERIRSIRQRGE